MTDDSDGAAVLPVRSACGGCSALDPRFDTANRLERSIDVQIRTIEGIDEKAKHVTRLLGILVGVVLSVLSLGLQTDWILLSEVGTLTLLAFGVGIGSLLLSMAAATITYLNSRFLVGLDERAGTLLSDPAVETDSERHFHRLVGGYSHAIEINRYVIRANSRRFRRTQVLLLAGVVYLSTAAILFVGNFATALRLGLLAAATSITVGVSWHVLSGNYLTVEEVGGVNEQ